MKKRYAVLGLSMVFALALAVPALGGPSNPIANASADAKTIAEKALKQAKAAKKAAKAARTTANEANAAAGSASSAATKAQKAAEGAQGTANTAKSAADAAKAAADSAKAAADSAKALAETKMSNPTHFEGEPGASASAIGCGSQVPTGGGFIVLGNDNDAATVTESTQYLSGWIVLADQIEGTAGSNWEVVATVNCATAP